MSTEITQNPSNPTTGYGRAEAASIDASLRWPVLLFTGLGLLWLLAAVIFGFIASVQLHSPSFLADCPWFTHGRVRAAHETMLIYGWGMNAAFAVGLWLLGRLGRIRASGYTGVLVIGAL